MEFPHSRKPKGTSVLHTDVPRDPRNYESQEALRAEAAGARSRAAQAQTREVQTGGIMARTVTASLYSLLFRRTSTFALTITVAALFFERAFDQGADALYEHINEGKLWKHIKHKYENKE